MEERTEDRGPRAEFKAPRFYGLNWSPEECQAAMELPTKLRGELYRMHIRYKENMGVVR